MGYNFCKVYMNMSFFAVQTEVIRRWRGPLLGGLSIIALVMLQPASPLPFLRWAFPVLSLGLVVITWIIVRGDGARRRQQAFIWMTTIAIGLLLLKTPVIAEFVARSLRINAGIDARSASLTDLEWLGLSYIALRLIAVLIDLRADRLPPFTFVELLVYTLFPLTVLAGPIDRLQRFLPDLRADVALRFSGGERVLMGLFKKFVLADTLALIALNSQIAADVRGVFGAWLVVYVYALQIYLDFSGYSDMVIGLGRMIGFTLPENFNAPYLKPNLSRFWQNWHMSLTDWFRGYCFLPMSRHLLRTKFPLPPYVIAQVTTMLLIGAWHGVTVNFFLWAMWHAIGLILQRWFGQRMRRHILRWRERPALRHLLDVFGVLLTFHYVAVGWVFFALPEPGMSFDHLKRMFAL
jgi:D-alanyl-lipoteichoic acid acyltransferase DltB (MBOAT superfamily)